MHLSLADLGHVNVCQSRGATVQSRFAGTQKSDACAKRWRKVGCPTFLRTPSSHCMMIWKVASRIPLDHSPMDKHFCSTETVAAGSDDVAIWKLEALRLVRASRTDYTSVLQSSLRESTNGCCNPRPSQWHSFGHMTATSGVWSPMPAPFGRESRDAKPSERTCR